MSGHEGPGGVRRSRRARWYVITAALVVVVGTVSVVVMTRVTSEAGQVAKAPPPVETAKVEKTDLREEEEANGTLGYGAEESLSGRKPGTITSLPAAGTVLSRGKAVYGVDAKPVPLFYGTLPFFRDLADGATDGPDVRQLEENLKALGFGGFGTPDKKFTSATAAALKKWQKSLGVEQTGTFGQGDAVLAPGEIRVSQVAAQLGGPSGGELLKYTGTERVVEVKLDAAKQAIAKEGDKVGIDITGGKSTTGVVTEVGKVAESGKDGSGQDDGKPKIKVKIKLDDPAAAGSLDSTPVSVRFTKEVHSGVLAVPVGALLALAEGGYAVEVDEGGKRRLVAVKTGLFSGGRVEITGTGLAAGTRVVTTS
ncbi:peptidoglycan-binding protein [Amycolatopsis regifaucium]|uniref:Peptidoglycan-binding protein n=1 Tax=Amycolatopsis regifaucium TaxID=546365 RepID=A0A154MSM4_9PSEU|nr:peptidoglycan-binding protein [Amycolatopsis regifaucium]KZB87286.1 peptidoglycan-binding protein [Amycolatopsis regifaucium]OKA08120.1 peptidoglycan-binding protein [Amycolatopsis regifaucium]SFI40271.1 Multidrug efflux pump subunit AcrA (membrane-fusion protein) [Amycolatopsis regifaucium]